MSAVRSLHTNSVLAQFNLHPDLGPVLALVRHSGRDQQLWAIQSKTIEQAGATSANFAPGNASIFFLYCREADRDRAAALFAEATGLPESLFEQLHDDFAAKAIGSWGPSVRRYLIDLDSEGDELFGRLEAGEGQAAEPGKARIAAAESVRIQNRGCTDAMLGFYDRSGGRDYLTLRLPNPRSLPEEIPQISIADLKVTARP